MEALSQRLLRIASFVPQGARLLDVGSDHAYLPLYLLENGLIDFAIAGEVVEGPYQSALNHAQSSPQASQIQVRLADGLAAFEESDKIDTITICGMGGRLIVTILDKGKTKLDSIKRLILQPNNREDDLRIWLNQNSFTIQAEVILSENGKRYEIIVAEHGQENLSDLDLRFGPFLRQEHNQVFVDKWQQERAKLLEALSSIPGHHIDSRSAIFQKIKAIEEVLNES